MGPGRERGCSKPRSTYDKPAGKEIYAEMEGNHRQQIEEGVRGVGIHACCMRVTWDKKFNPGGHILDGAGQA
jgi:hypothetical protein